MTDTLEGVNPALASIAQRIVDESGGRITISSGARSAEEQQVLYDRYKAGNGPLAAKPGTSKHEHGEAIDFGGDMGLLRQLATKYGLINSVPGEAWHWTLSGEDGAHTQRHSEYDLGPDTSSNPQDVLANRLNSILRIVGQSSATNAPTSGDPEVDRQLLRRPETTPEEGMAAVAQIPTEQPGATYTAGSNPRGAFQQAARKRLKEQYGMGDDEMGALITLWDKESGWNPHADNPNSTAFGIAQFLDSTWQGTGTAKTTDPFQQIDAGLRYIMGRYGSPSNALKFHLKNNWY